ncbi:MAG: peptide deformylase [Patescibacteria group bacterium]
MKVGSITGITVKTFMAILDIVTYPNSILDSEAKKVDFPLDQETKDLIKNMWNTVKDQGIGLAAPQVGVNKQICIIHLDPELSDKHTKDLDFVMINPRITFYSQLEQQMIEGCLSFPEQYYEIWRPANIVVEYLDEKGKKKTLKAKDWLSRVIQHEVDHLNGKLFINMGGNKITQQDIRNKKVVD